MRSSDLKISAGSKTIKGKIALTGSKSESNRALILKALSGGKVQVSNLSEAADTVTLTAILEDNSSSTIDVGPAGTAMRFLTAFYCLQNREVVLTGSERMQQRPIGILVDALRHIGANISYVGNEGFPPLQISGSLIQENSTVSITGNISSQYISSLLLIAPVLHNGLTLDIQGELTSQPYVEMTLAMMEQAGIKHSWSKNQIRIEPQTFTESEILVEPDWSAASYWYAIAALSDEAELSLPALRQYSLQGDSRITEIMANFGISSSFIDGGVLLKKEDKPFLKKRFNLKDCPDLAQSVIVCAAVLGHEASFSGLETLKIKETDRIAALQNELAKIGVKLIEDNQVYTLDCSGLNLPQQLYVHTYDDHRMAMAFAPLALKIPELIIEDGEVVAKSYPDYWKHLEQIGFSIAENQ